VKTFFKWDEPSRVEVRIARDAEVAANWRRVCRLVDQRDGRQCRSCGKRTDPDDVGLQRGHRHHIQYKSACGPDETWNIVTLCAVCHNEEEHRHRLRIEGNADEALTFWRKDADGAWYVVRRELAVRVVEKD
jgi:5-methylcytosine-specific restriction endonuclease McrA